MSSARAPRSLLRDPEPEATAFMSTRAWWLVGLNLLIPGAPQVLAGNRRFGRFALGTTLLFWALVIVALLAVLIGGAAIIPIVTIPAVLWSIAVVLGLYGVLWVICAVELKRWMPSAPLPTIKLPAIEALPAPDRKMPSCVLALMVLVLIPAPPDATKMPTWLAVMRFPR